MRRKFTTLCLALVGALMAFPTLAQVEDVTFKLKNSDMEQGLKGWTYERGAGMFGVGGMVFMPKYVMHANKKNSATQVGYHGMNQGVMEVWNSYIDPVGDGCVMQRVNGLPNGTYVFGAYIGAARQDNWEDVCERNVEGHILVDGKHQYKYWSNRDSIHGVTLFANEVAIPVATDNPDFGIRDCKWGHSAKFNIATQVTNGTLDVGLRIANTNANYVVWDNATLYYFGKMSEDAALDIMAEIDMERTVAIADTLVSVKMNVGSLANLQAAIAAAKSATTTAATLWNDAEELYWWMGQARKSVEDYRTLNEDIKAAKVILGGTWTQGSTPALLPALKTAIASAEQAYAEATLDHVGVTALRKELNWAAGDVKIDSVYAAKADLEKFIFEVARVLNRPGGYTSAQLESLSNLELVLQNMLEPYKYEMDANLPIEERTVNPNDIIPYIATIYNEIEAVRNNPIAAEYTKMPIVFKPMEEALGGYHPIQGTVLNSYGLYEFTSPRYHFQEKIKNFRITVNHAAADQTFFCLSELEFYNIYGEKIELEEVISNADHNSLNSKPDGGGIPALFDGSMGTFFHSAWDNMPKEAHYLEITFPEGGCDVFNFKMISRAPNSYDQKSTFPGDMILSTPMPEREALVTTLEAAKGLYPYFSPVAEPGFYKADFSALNDSIVVVENALKGYPSEEECLDMNNTLRALIERFNDADHSVYMPEAGKSYRIISAYPAFYEKQGMLKAITFNGEKGKLWWENMDVDSLKQEFVFEPLYDEAGEHLYLYGEYLYAMQHVETGLYVAYDENNLFVLADTPDSIVLQPLGGGQFNIHVCDSIKKEEDSDGTNLLSWNYQTLHAGDHNKGKPESKEGPYGGLEGIGSGICSWGTGMNDASAWLIREMAELPWTVSASNAANYRSEYIHLYEPTSTIFLTAANKICAFEGLTIYDLHGNVVPATIEVKGREATIALETEVTSFSFSLNNMEKVKMFTINTQESHPLTKLQVAYDAAVAVAPIKGTAVGMYADLNEYEAALAYAEPLLTGDASDEKMLGAIEILNEAVANLAPNMPDPNRYYYIVSALDAFKENHGMEMMMYGGVGLGWGYANKVDLDYCWRFVPAESEGGYYLLNMGSYGYIGRKEDNPSYGNMYWDMDYAIPFTIAGVQGDIVVIKSEDTKGIHPCDHKEGKWSGGEIIYYSIEDKASQWRICDVEVYERDYAMYMFRANAEAGESANVTIELENPEAVTAIEFDLCLPEGVALEGVAVDYMRVPVPDGFLVGSTLQENNVCHISFERNEGALVGYSGAVFHLTLQTVGDMAAGEYAINLSNIVVTTVCGEEAAIADFASSIMVTKYGNQTCIDAVETEGHIYGIDSAVVAECNANMQFGIYTMAGQLVKMWNVKPGKNTMPLPTGIYLVNGQKVVVK